jgi:4-amino-4-deoxy-L-arabinose transferase-like glycosyltransferase
VPRFHLWVGVLLVVAAGIRVAALASSHDWIVLRVPVLDAGFYHATARELLTGDWPGREPFFMGPLYTYVLGGAYALFGADPLVGRILNAALGIVALALVARIARRVAGEVAALAALGIGALYGPAIFYEQVLLMATLLSVLALVMLDRALALRDAPSWRAAVPLGLALGAAMALRGSTILYLVPIAWCVRGRLVGRYGLGALAAAALVVLPFTVHNLRSGSSALLTTNLGWNLFIGNHEGARGTFAYPNGWRSESDPTGREFASQLAGRPLSLDETNAFWIDRTREALARDPARVASHLARKLYVFLHPEEMPQNESYRFFLGHVPPARLALFGWWLLLPLGVVAKLTLFGRRGERAPCRREVVSIVLFAAVPLLACLIFFVTGRYRFPSVPFMLVLAGIGTAWIADRLGTRPVRGALATAGVLAACFLLVLLPAPFDRDRALARDHEHVGLRYQREGSMRAAEEQYRLALEVKPDDGDALNNLGTVLMADGRIEEARAVFERAAAAMPENPVPLENLATALARLEENAAAEAVLRRAVAIDPGNVTLWSNLGTALALQGRFREAITAYERADRLAPGNPEVRGMLQSARDFLRAGEEGAPDPRTPDPGAGPDDTSR